MRNKKFSRQGEPNLCIVGISAFLTLYAKTIDIIEF